ncbi:MAG: leucine-rich repeat domain-containing protein [Anaerotignum sp.]
MLRVIEDTKLKNIADAIREKNRTEEQMTVDVMPDAIRSIQTASGEKVPKKDVNFYDYDGEILYSYTAAETAELTEMPALPIREGLICQGWNMTLDYVKAYTADYGKCDIGATYITDDGKTRLYIRIESDGRMELPLYFSQTVAHGVTIDWGDGSSQETVAGTGSVNTKHTYGSIGEYLITMEPEIGCELGFGNEIENTSIFNDLQLYGNMLQDIRIGRGVTSIGEYALYNCIGLASITIPNSVTSIGEGVFYDCYCLTYITIPNSVTSIGKYAFYECYCLASITIPNSVTSIGEYAFYNCKCLGNTTIPNSVISIGEDAFYECYCLTHITIPNSVTSIGEYAFYNCKCLGNTTIPNSVTSIVRSAFADCYCLASITIPNSVTSIGEYAFYSCKSMKYYDFSKHTEVPTLVSINAFSKIPSDCEIRVPAALEEAWKAATNWVNYARYIVGV